jgi:hypothetical protein
VKTVGPPEQIDGRWSAMEQESSSLGVPCRQWPYLLQHFSESLSALFLYRNSATPTKIVGATIASVSHSPTEALRLGVG